MRLLLCLFVQVAALLPAVAQTGNILDVRKVSPQKRLEEACQHTEKLKSNPAAKALTKEAKAEIGIIELWTCPKVNAIQP